MCCKETFVSRGAPVSVDALALDHGPDQAREEAVDVVLWGFHPPASVLRREEYVLNLEMPRGGEVSGGSVSQTFEVDEGRLLVREDVGMARKWKDRYRVGGSGVPPFEARAAGPRVAPKYSKSPR